MTALFVDTELERGFPCICVLPPTYRFLASTRGSSEVKKRTGMYVTSLFLCAWGPRYYRNLIRSMMVMTRMKLGGDDGISIIHYLGGKGEIIYLAVLRQLT
jgi:hypothetical protein